MPLLREGLLHREMLTLMVTSKKPSFYSRRHLKAAYRSGLEERNASLLRDAFPGQDPVYERYTIAYTIPSREAHYTPDFLLPNGIIVETKGRFLPEDRQKHILIKQQHPELDIRFVFTCSNRRLYKGSPTTYAMWCHKNGFQYADRLIPRSWLMEPLVRRRWEKARQLLKLRGK